MAYGDEAKIKINPQAIDALLSSVLQKKIKQLDAEFRLTIQSPVFYWENTTTRRRNGDVVGPTRDAVDTGKLLRSQRVQFYKSGTAVIKWNVDYAKDVFDHFNEGDMLKFTIQRMRG